MKLNPHILKLSLFFALGLVARSEAGVSFEVTGASESVERGITEADMNWQSLLEFGFGDFYAGGWSLAPLEEKGSPNFFDERYELYAGYGWALADRLGLDAGAIRYLNPNAEDTTEAYLGLFAELGTFSPSIYIYNDIDRDQWVAEAATTLSVPLDLFPFDATARLGAVEGDVDYRYFELDLVYPLELTDAANLSLGLHYSDNDFGMGVPDSRLYGSASVSLRF